MVTKSFNTNHNTVIASRVSSRPAKLYFIPDILASTMSITLYAFGSYVQFHDLSVKSPFRDAAVAILSGQVTLTVSSTLAWYLNIVGIIKFSRAQRPSMLTENAHVFTKQTAHMETVPIAVEHGGDEEADRWPLFDGIEPEKDIHKTPKVRESIASTDLLHPEPGEEVVDVTPHLRGDQITLSPDDLKPRAVEYDSPYPFDYKPATPFAPVRDAHAHVSAPPKREVAAVFEFFAVFNVWDKTQSSGLRKRKVTKTGAEFEEIFLDEPKVSKNNLKEKVTDFLNSAKKLVSPLVAWRAFGLPHAAASSRLAAGKQTLTASLKSDI